MPPECTVETGIVTCHFAKLADLAEETKTITAIRPVELAASSLIEAGDYQGPTKDMYIKGKSSNWGPMAGCIPVDQMRWSKLAGQERASQYTEAVKGCIEDGFAQAVPLTLTSSRIDELEKLNCIECIGTDDGQIIFTATSPGGEKYEFVGREVSDGRFEILYEGEPIQVLGKVFEGKEFILTADYDLFFIAPKEEKFGPDDMPLIKQIDFEQYQKEHQRRLSRVEVAGSVVNPTDKLISKRAGSVDSYFMEEDLSMGNVSPRVREFIHKINEKLNRAEGFEVVHHNQDATNRFTDMGANFPVTVFVPDDILTSTAMQQFRENQGITNYQLDAQKDVIYLRDISELVTFVQMAKNLGYYVPLNPLWPENVTSIRKSSYDSALAFFRDKEANNNFEPLPELK